MREDDGGVVSPSGPVQEIQFMFDPIHHNVTKQVSL